MKPDATIFQQKGQASLNIYSLLTLLILCLASTPLFTQTETEEGEDELSEPELVLSYTARNNQTRVLTVTCKVESEDVPQPVENIEIKFYRTVEDPASLIGTSLTDKKGKATLILTKEEELFTAGNPDQTYLAIFEGNDEILPAEASLTIRESTLLMELDADVDPREVRVQLLGMNDQGIMEPVPDVDIALYVKRLFGLLPLSEYPETTDEDGSAVIAFPDDIPGDTNGYITIVSRVEEHELFGNLETITEIDWGIPLVIDPSLDQHQLWSSRSNAPWNLIILVNAVLVGVWGVIIYILYQIINIWRIGKALL